MPELSTFTGKFRLNLNGLDKSSSMRVKKRPRESFVCNQCRRSKVRCDRGQPCQNCLKRDEGGHCSYQQPLTASGDPDRHVTAEDRLLRLESVVKQLMQNQPPVHSANAETAPERPAESDTQLQLEQVDGLTFVGPTHWSSVLEDIQDLREVLGSSQDSQSTPEHITMEEPSLRGEPIFGCPNYYTLEDCLSSMPPRVEVDRLVSIYFRGETFVIPFIHTYHFHRQYRDFWADPNNVNPLWLSILFSICHIASMVTEATGSYSPSQKTLDAKRSVLHAAAGKCLVLGEYHRPQTFALEALAMYGNCKNFTSLDPSREVGAILSMVIRMAYEMGYHRDPDSFKTFTAFEGEMRRRFWAVCKQFDLMISFMLGLPSNICLANCDTKPPKNLLDSDFDENTKELPASRSENEPTRLLWFIVKNRQMDSFSKVCEDSLSFREKSEAEIIQLDAEIRKMHAMTPECLRTRSLENSIIDPPFLILTRIYIEFIYLKSLCALHRKYMVRGIEFSTQTCVEAGTQLVSQFIGIYKEFSPGGLLHAECWMLTNFTMNDFLLGVMVLCLVVYTRRKRDCERYLIEDSTGSQVIDLLEKSHTICKEKSSESRDARRVSHAIRLTLNRVKSSDLSRNSISQDSQTSPRASSLDVQVMVDGMFGSDVASSSLYPRTGNVQGNESAFGLLDPFNFMNNDLENIDWSIFETQFPAEDTMLGDRI